MPVSIPSPKGAIRVTHGVTDLATADSANGHTFPTVTLGSNQDSFLVGEPGLEPGTSRSRSARATKLRYSPMAEDSVASQSLYRPLGGASLGFAPGG